MVRNGNVNAATRRLYRRPQISRIKLVAEEAVLTACKMYIVPSPAIDQNACYISDVSKCVVPGS